MWTNLIFPAVLAFTRVLLPPEDSAPHLGHSLSTDYTLPPWVTTTLVPPTTPRGSGSSVVPNKQEVWKAQQYCGKLVEQLEHEMSQCDKLATNLDNLEGLTSLLNCIEGTLRLEEATCSCVKAGMALYSFTWEDTDPHAICSDTVTSCRVPGNSTTTGKDAVGKIETMRTIFSEAKNYLARANDSIQSVLGDPTLDKIHESSILETWSSDFLNFGRKVKTLRMIGGDACGSLQSTIASFLPEIWRIQQICWYSQAQLVKQVGKCEPWTESNDLSEANDLLTCIQNVEQWEDATCSCVHQALKLFGLEETELSAVCAVRSRNCSLTNTTSTHGLTSHGVDTLRNITYFLGKQLDQAGNPLYHEMTLPTIPTILTDWENKMQVYGVGQEQLGQLSDQICGSIKLIISELDEPKNSTTLPDKYAVWSVQQQCDDAEQELLDLFKTCQNWKATDGQKPLEILLFCVQQFQRLEENTCNCVRVGLSLYGWNSTSLDSICLTNPRICGAPLPSRMLNDTRDSMDLNLLVSRGQAELKSAKGPLLDIIKDDNLPSEQVLTQWEIDIQAYGRTQEQVGQMAEYTCAVIKEAIYEGTTGDMSRRGGHGSGGGGGGGGCPWYLFLFCWINDLFNPLNFPWSHGGGGDPVTPPNTEPTTTSTTTTTTTTTTARPPPDDSDSCQASLEANHNSTQNKLKQCEKELNKLDDTALHRSTDLTNATLEAVCCFERVVQKSLNGGTLSEIAKVSELKNNFRNRICQRDKKIDIDEAPWNPKFDYDRILRMWGRIRSAFSNATDAVKKARDFFEKKDNSKYKDELSVYGNRIVELGSLSSNMVAVVQGYEIMKRFENVKSNFALLAEKTQQCDVLQNIVETGGYDQRIASLDFLDICISQLAPILDQAKLAVELLAASIPVVNPTQILERSLSEDLASLSSEWDDLTVKVRRVMNSDISAAETELNSNLDSMEVKNSTFSKFSDYMKHFAATVSSVEAQLPRLHELIAALKIEATTTTTPEPATPPPWVGRLETFQAQITQKYSKLKTQWPNCRENFISLTPANQPENLARLRECSKQLVPLALELVSLCKDIRDKYDLPSLRDALQDLERHLPYKVEAVDVAFERADPKLTTSTEGLRAILDAPDDAGRKARMDQYVQEIFYFEQGVSTIQVNLEDVVTTIDQMFALTTTTPKTPPAWVGKLETFQAQITQKYSQLKMQWPNCRSNCINLTPSNQPENFARLRECSAQLSTLALELVLLCNDIRDKLVLPSLRDALQDLERNLPYTVEAVDVGFEQADGKLASSASSLKNVRDTPDDSGRKARMNEYVQEIWYFQRSVSTIQINLEGVASTIDKIFALTTTTTTQKPVLDLHKLMTDQTDLSARFLTLQNNWMQCRVNPQSELVQFAACSGRLNAYADSLVSAVDNVRQSLSDVMAGNGGSFLKSPSWDEYNAQLNQLVQNTDALFKTGGDHYWSGNGYLENANKAGDRAVQDNLLSNYDNELGTFKACVQGISYELSLIVQKVAEIMRNPPPTPPPAKHRPPACCAFMFICCFF